MKTTVLKKALQVLAGVSLAGAASAQVTPGRIFQNCAPVANPLDPNGDSWVSATGTPFTVNERTEFEIHYFSIPGLGGEPDADPQTGASCGTTDIVDNPNTLNDCSYLFYDNADGINDNGDDRMLYRIRCASPRMAGNFGFNLLFDTDNRMGFAGPNADPNAVPGNPGFEIEIRIRTGGGPGVFIDNVDGTISGVNMHTYALGTHYQQAYAFWTDPDCAGHDPVFHDVWVLMSDMGLTSSSPVRIASATSMSGNSALAGSASDIGGVDDNAYPNQDSIWITTIRNQTSTPTGYFGPTGTGFLAAQVSNLSATSLQNSVRIDWSTSAEFNSGYFTISRSDDGQQFSEIGTVDASGFSSGKVDYSFTDFSAGSAGHFYRLNLTDLDGATRQLGIVEVGASISESGMKLYPNPSSGKLVLEGNGLTALSICDAAGRQVYESEVEGEDTYTVNQFDLSSLGKGVYFVKVSRGNLTETRRWLKQ